MKDFKILECYKDYSSPTLYIQFEGILDEEILFNEIKSYYPECVRVVIIDHNPETEFRGLKNVGTLTLKLL